MRRKGRKTQGRGWYDMFSENCKVQGEKLFEGPHNDIKTKALCLLPVRFSLDGVPPCGGPPSRTSGLHMNERERSSLPTGSGNCAATESP